MRHNIFPAMAMSNDTLGEPVITLEGQKVVFDKKVSLLPADIKKEKSSNLKGSHGKHE